MLGTSITPESAQDRVGGPGGTPITVTTSILRRLKHDIYNKPGIFRSIPESLNFGTFRQTGKTGQVDLQNRGLRMEISLLLFDRTIRLRQPKIPAIIRILT
jgi:hypothetical protein